MDIENIRKISLSYDEIIRKCIDIGKNLIDPVNLDAKEWAKFTIIDNKVHVKCILVTSGYYGDYMTETESFSFDASLLLMDDKDMNSWKVQQAIARQKKAEEFAKANSERVNERERSEYMRLYEKFGKIK